VVWDATDEMVVARFNADGSPDTSFGADGSGVVAIPNDTDTFVDHVLEQPDGRLLVTGESPEGLSVVMLNADGSVDTDFGGGLRTYDVFGGFPDEAVTYNDGVWVTDSGQVLLTAMKGPNLVTLRLTGLGHPDASFAANGFTSSPVDADGDPLGQDALVAARQTGDGGMVGYVDVWPADASHHLVRVTVDAGGNVVGQKAVATGLRASPEIDGTYGFDFIVAFSGDGSAFVSAQGQENRIAKLTPGGELDASFGDGGLATLPTPYALLYSATPDGGALVEAGRFNTAYFGAEDAVVKLTANGAIDSSFNAGEPAGMGALPAVQTTDGSTWMGYAGGGYDSGGAAVGASMVLQKLSAQDVETQVTGDPAAMAAIARGRLAAGTPEGGLFVDDLYGVVWQADGNPGVLEDGGGAGDQVS
jgi:uncharacterized delta-60 repeat protein